MVQVEKNMKLRLHKGPSGVGRPLVVEVGTLCMLTMWAVDVQFGTGLEKLRFLPNKNGPSFWEGP